jgi:O-acetyl-ADP-ribose deacetylase (regulator of RNase III)
VRVSSIERHVGNLLDVTTGIIVHGCNACGVMGAGVAKAVKDRYPGAYQLYRRMYEGPGLTVGNIVPYEVPTLAPRPELLIVNAITQQDYGTNRRQVDYEGLFRCFSQIPQLAMAYQLRDVHFPLIGCGLAGGDWDIVEAIIESTLKGLAKHLWVLE